MNPPDIRYVVTLDLSKKSTGVAIGAANLTDRTLQIPRWHTVKPHEGVRLSRAQHVGTDAIVHGVEALIVHEPWFASRRFTVAVEANVWGATSSEFQYYLGQEALRWCEALGVDCIAYNNSTVKAFVRRWSPVELPKKLGGAQGKATIERVWRTAVRPLAPDALPCSITSTDDAVDAGWIALLALYAQATYLPVGHFDPAVEPALLWAENDALRTRFMKGKLSTFENLGAPDLSTAYTLLRDNKHLGVLSTGFYPFRQLQALAAKIDAEYAADPAATLRTVMGRTAPSLSTKAVRTLLEQGDFRCGLDNAGRWTLSPR